MSASPLSGAEFTLYNTNSDGSKGSARATRTAGSDGTVKFYGLAPGSYILVETKSPDEYENPYLEYGVVVGSDLKTTVNGSDTITNLNPFAVANYKADDPVGSLTISKTVTGDGADVTKAFDFTLTLDDADGVYTYVGHNVSGGTIQSGDTISLAHGQSITIVGLPTDTTYTVAEADYTIDGYATTSTGSTGIIETNTTQIAAFTNTRTIGSLSITKTVAGNAGDIQKEFDFTLTLNNAPALYPYTGSGVPDGTIQSGDTISLAHGQSITITDLPEGATYTVTEADYTIDGYSTVSIGATGSIEKGATQTAAFTNTNSTPPAAGGNLTISKTVVGAARDTSKQFYFRITLVGAPDTYAYIGSGVPDGTIQSGDSISLAHGQSITITGLPEGATYTVTEADYTGDGYAVSSVGAVGSIVEGATQTAAFINAKEEDSPVATTGSLTIRKTVAGNAADSSKSFDFTLTLSGANSIYAYIGNGVPNGTIQSGDSISLAHGQSITITGLPEGASYTVTEADYTIDGYVASSVDAVGSIAGDAAQIAAFTNTKNALPVGSLTIQKTVTGDLGDKEQAFTFIVDLGADGSYPYSGSKTGTIQSGQTVTLKHGESIVIQDIPAGTTYLVTEKEANQDGYTATEASGVITLQGQTAAFVNSKSSATQTGDDNASAIVKFGLLLAISALLALALITLKLKKHKLRR